MDFWSALDKIEAVIDQFEKKRGELKDAVENERERQRNAGHDYETITEAMEDWVAQHRSDDPVRAYNARARMSSLLRRIIDRIEFIPDDSGERHGRIQISFKGADSYHRIIYVEKGQKQARSVKVVDGVEDKSERGPLHRASNRGRVEA